MVGVAEEDLVNYSRTTSGNGQASSCLHCYASQMTEVDGQSSRQMCLSEYLNDAWVLVSLGVRIHTRGAE